MPQVRRRHSPYSWLASRMYDLWSHLEVLQLLTILSTVVTSLIGLIAVRSIRTVHILMNSRMEQLLEGAVAKGIVQERDSNYAKKELELLTR